MTRLNSTRFATAGLPVAPSFDELLELRAYGRSMKSESGLLPSEYVKRMDADAREASDAEFDALGLS